MRVFRGLQDELNNRREKMLIDKRHNEKKRLIRSKRQRLGKRFADGVHRLHLLTRWPE